MSDLFKSTVAFIKPPQEEVNMGGTKLQRSDSSEAVIKFEILNPKHEKNPKYKCSNVQNRI
jgi:hypothetical protein